MLHIKNFVFNSFREHCYLVWDDTLEGVIIDPGACSDYEKDTLYEEVASDKLKIKYVLLTHAHFDHIYAVKACADKYGAEVLMNPAEWDLIKELVPMSDRFGMPCPDTSFRTGDLRDGDIVRFGQTSFKVIATPGHSPGGVCFYDEADKVIFTGDTLFAGTIGRTDVPLGNYDDLIKGIMEKLMVLPGDVDIIPGHGYGSNIAEERTSNPFLQPFNEPEENEKPADDSVNPIEIHPLV